MLKTLLIEQLFSCFLVANAQSARSTLFEHGTVIAFNEELQTNEVLYNTSILVRGDTIEAIFSSSEADSFQILPGTDRVSAEKMIISPGFIDTHRHSWQTTYRTIASNISLAEYFVRYSPSSNVLSFFTPDDMYLSNLVGLYEALNAGVTSLLDHSHGISSRDIATASLNAYFDSGARVFFGYGLDSSGSFPLLDRMANYRELSRDQRLLEGLVKMGVAFDSFSDLNDTDLQELVNFVKNENISVLTSHWLDGAWNIRHNPSLFRQLGLLNQSFPIVLSHGSFISPTEYGLLKEYNVYVSITPESEMHFGHTNYESDLIMDQAALGVDTHATYSGDMVTQARLWLQSVRLRSYRNLLDHWKIPRYSPMSVNQAFHLATRAGAQALRRPDLGVLQVGAKADIVVFDGASINMVGWRDPIAAIILHSNVGDVVHVMVGGKLVKRDGILVAENLANITESFARSAERIQSQAINMEYELQGRFSFNPALPFGIPDRVDAVRGNGTGY
ncbi:hypothetical protein AAE478_003893 [Parahypoxylon ruwenzoriense]